MVQVMFIDGPIEFVFDCPPYNYLCTRTFYATDNAGNTAEAIQMITVADTIAPVFLNQPEDVIEVNEQGEEIPDPFVAIQDACDGNAQWSSEDMLLKRSVIRLLICEPTRPRMHAGQRILNRPWLSSWRRRVAWMPGV